MRFFAMYRERAGTSQVDMDLPEGATPEDLMARLRSAFPSLPTGSSALVAVNSEYADPKAPLHQGDEVVFIPAVSGG
ncbi:MAG: molybdopterin converting factor, subunit 1 [Dehalococcoidia bacterium]|nr:molybdopterin converting factor, subunit 1 [Dehalococcoidia bacterium]